MVDVRAVEIDDYVFLSGPNIVWTSVWMKVDISILVCMPKIHVFGVDC